MSYAERHIVTVTSATGTGEGYTPVVTGRILQIAYVKPVADSYANGVDFTITVEGTQESVWVEQNVNATTSRSPRAATHSTAGAAAVYAAAGEAVRDHIAVANDRIKIAIAEAGTATTGAFHVLIG